MSLGVPAAAQRAQVVQTELDGGEVCRARWAALRYGSHADAAEALRTCVRLTWHTVIL